MKGLTVSRLVLKQPGQHGLYLAVLLCLLTGLATPVFGQASMTPCDKALIEADGYYQQGQFDRAMNTLDQIVFENCNLTSKVAIYRLKAMVYLVMDDLPNADAQLVQLLTAQPYYRANPVTDPALFQDRLEINRRKLFEVQVTSVSKKAEGILEAPAQIIVINNEEFMLRGYENLVDLLEDLPGFSISRFQGPEYANIYQRGLRTNNTEKTLLLIDGIEENDLWTNWAYISRQYSLSNIERVEVIYGPASTTYGPNAFVGVINIVTKEAGSLIKTGQNVGISAMTGVGSFNTRYVDATVAAQNDDGSASISLTGRVFLSDEFNMDRAPYFDYDVADVMARDYTNVLTLDEGAAASLTALGLPANSTLYNLSSNGDSLSLTAAGIARARQLDSLGYISQANGQPTTFTNGTEAYQVSAKARLDNFTMGFLYWFKSEGGTSQFTDQLVAAEANGQVWVPEHLLTYFNYEKRFSDKFLLTALMNFRDHNVNGNTKLVAFDSYIDGDRDIDELVNGDTASWETTYFYQRSKQLRTEARLLFTPDDKWDLLLGAEYRNSQMQGNYLTSSTPFPQDSGVFDGPDAGGNQFNIIDYGYFTQATYKPNVHLNITAGVRVDNNLIRNEGGFGTQVSPRLGIVYHRNLWGLKTVYARGIMNVSNWSKFSTAGNREPNPRLDTETIQNVDISAYYKPLNNLEVRVDGFYMFVDDVVNSVTLGDGTTQNRNVGAFRIVGTTVGLRHEQGPIKAYLNYSYIMPRQLRDGDSDQQLRVGDIPSHQINAGGTWQARPDLWINLRGNFQSQRPVGTGTNVGLNQQQAELGSFMQLNGTVTYQTPITGLKVQLIGRNLTNATINHPGTRTADGLNAPSFIPQAGINANLRLWYQF